MGSCELDLRQATLEGPEVNLVAIAIMGSVEITVPEGVEVELSGFAPMGSLECKTSDASGQSELPGLRVHVTGFALMGSVEVKTRPARSLTPLGSGAR
jgi:hypothetical protein